MRKKQFKGISFVKLDNIKNAIMTMADADKRDSKIVRTQKDWRAGREHRSDLSLALLKEKMTKITQITWEIQSYPKALKMLLFLEFITANSLCSTGRTLRSFLSCMAGSLGTHRSCRVQMPCSEWGSPGSKTHNRWPLKSRTEGPAALNLPVAHTGVLIGVL